MRKIVRIVTLTLIALATILSPAQADEDLQRERREVQQLIERFKHDLAVHAEEIRVQAEKIRALKALLLQLAAPSPAPVVAPTAPACEIP